MEEDLNGSTLFDGRLFHMLSEISMGKEQSVLTPMNAFERSIFTQREDIKALADAAKEIQSDGLTWLLQRHKDYVAPRHALIFLMKAHRRGILADALAALDRATTMQKTLDEFALKKILREAEDLPMALTVDLFSNQDERRYRDRKQEPSSSLELDKFNDFR